MLLTGPGFNHFFYHIYIITYFLLFVNDEFRGPGRGGGLGNRHAHLGEGGQLDDLSALEFQLITNAVDDHIGGFVESVIVGSPFNVEPFGQDALEGDSAVLLLAVLVGFDVGFPLFFGTEGVGFVLHELNLVGVGGVEANLDAVGTACPIKLAGFNVQTFHKGEVDHLLVGVAVDVVVGEGEVLIGGDGFGDSHWGVLLASFVVLIIPQVRGLVNPFFEIS